MRPESFIYLYDDQTQLVVSNHYPVITAVIVDGDGNVVRGHAKCHESDQFDFEFGRKLATARATARYGRKLERSLARAAK